MKQIRFLILLILATIIFSSCCELDKLQYHFFSEDELKLLWEGEDLESAMNLQHRLSTGEVEKNSVDVSWWGKIDTIPFINNQSGDTLKFTYIYGLNTGVTQWFSNDKPMIATTEVYLSMIDYKTPLYTYEESFICSMRIQMEKTMTELAYSFEFAFNDNGKKKSMSGKFVLTDSITIQGIYDVSTNTHTITYLKNYIENYQFNDEELENCLIFEFNDQNQTEIFKVIYSNKYGFLKFIKDNNYEIERLL